MELKMLEPTLRSKLRSGVAIAKLSQCVGELVENSIDAGATCIAVRVNIAKFKVQVVDNGCGLSYDDLCLVGERYMTSKCHTVDDISTNLTYFGYRGEAIASIVDVSGTVELCSRHRLSQNTYSKIFYSGSAMPVTASKSHRPSVGTTVNVHDFFYNLPVRKNGISAAFELEQVKQIVENIALMNPSISFSMRNDATGECILQTHKTDSVMHRFGLLFGRDKTTTMKDVVLSQDSLELSGFISTEGHHNKSLQFIYVNRRIIKKTPLHSRMNNMLANSLLTRKLSMVAESNLRKSQEGANELVSPRRTPDMFAVYVLHIKCPISEYDICLEPAKTLIEFKDWDRIISAVDELVQDFLFKSNLTITLIHPTAPNSVQNQHELSTSCMITADRSDDNPHLPTNSDLNNSMLSPSLQSRTVRWPHLASLSSKQIKLGNSHLPQYVRVIETDMAMVESKRAETPGKEPDEDNHTTRTALADDHPLQMDLPNSNAMLPVLPPCARSEYTYDNQDGGEQLVTYSRPLNCLHFCKKHCKQPTADNDKICSDFAAMSPGKVPANRCQQYPSLFLSTYPCISNRSTHISSTGGGQLMGTSQMQNDSVNFSNDSGNVATCAPFMSSTEPSNTQDCSPQAHISYRSPLQSSMSFKLSELFRKKELTSKSSVKKKVNITYQHHPPRTSLVSGQSVSLEWKRSECSHNAVAVNLDTHSKLPHGEDIPLPQSLPLTSSVAGTYTCTCASGYLSKPVYTYNGIYPIFSYAPSDMNCVPTVRHSQVSTTLGHPMSLEICSTKPTYSLTLPSEPATASCHAMESTSSFTESTIIMSRKADVEDEHSIQNTDFTNEIASTTESLSFDSKKPVWKEVTDPATGRTLYMHSKSGSCVSSLAHTSSEIYKGSHHDSQGRGSMDNSFISSSSMDITGGLSKSLDTELLSHQNPKCHKISLNNDRNFTSNSDLSVSSLPAVSQPRIEFLDTKWQHQRELNQLSSTHGCEMANYVSFDDIFKGWKNPTFQGGEETVIRIGDRNQSQIKVHTVINQYKFSQEMFSTIKVLGQVDNKFIACLLDSQSRGSHDLLVMIDQHAAHERIRLESLLNDLYVANTSTSGGVLPPQIRSSTVHPPLAINLQPGEVNLARLFHQQLKRYGLSLKFLGSNEVLVTSLPSVFMEREVSEVRRGRPTVAPIIIKDMIIKQVELLQATCGVAASIPETILNVLSSQACHSAIKFGDTLTVSECRALIFSLSKCKLPFQCAHGRPALVPILDLCVLNRRHSTLKAAPFPSLSKLGHDYNNLKYVGH